AGMLAYIGVNGSTISANTIAQVGAVVGRPGTYHSVVAGQTLTVSDPSKGVIANDTNVYGVTLLTAPTKGTLTLNANGSFTYVPNAGWSGPDSFVYCANGSVSGTVAACSSPYTATATLNAATVEGASGITVFPRAYAAATATSLAIKAPGVLGKAYDTLNNPADSDAAGYPLS